MDQATLVTNQIDDVTRVVAQLKRDSIDVNVAFWLYTSETDQWFLYIATDLVNRTGITDAYKTALRSMRQLPGSPDRSDSS